MSNITLSQLQNGGGEPNQSGSVQNTQTQQVQNNAPQNNNTQTQQNNNAQQDGYNDQEKKEEKRLNINLIGVKSEGGSENPPGGEYLAVVKEIYPIEDKDFKSGEPVNKLKWIFEIEGQRVGDQWDKTFAGKNITKKTSLPTDMSGGLKLNTQSNTFKFYEAINGPVQDGQDMPILNCIGKKVMMVLEVHPNKRNDENPYPYVKLLMRFWS